MAPLVFVSIGGLHETSLWGRKEGDGDWLICDVGDSAFILSVERLPQEFAHEGF